MIHLFTDADNTLWDTNAVYASAQVGLVRDVGASAARPVPTSNADALALLRGVDQRLAVARPEGLLYPPALLAAALRLVLAGTPRDDAVADALSRPGYDPAADAILARFAERLATVPLLRVGVREGLSAAGAAGVPITVLTEERSERCRMLLAAHGLLPMIMEVVSLRKTAAAYRTIREALPGTRLLIVGDQPDRDVEAPRQAGFETFLFRSGFVPYWNAEGQSRPDHEITRYDDIVSFLEPLPGRRGETSVGPPVPEPTLPRVDSGLRALQAFPAADLGSHRGPWRAPVNCASALHKSLDCLTHFRVGEEPFNGASAIGSVSLSMADSLAGPLLGSEVPSRPALTGPADLRPPGSPRSASPVCFSPHAAPCGGEGLPLPRAGR